jgi:hypothetical protein
MGFTKPDVFIPTSVRKLERCQENQFKSPNLIVSILMNPNLIISLSPSLYLHILSISPIKNLHFLFPSKMISFISDYIINFFWEVRLGIYPSAHWMFRSRQTTKPGAEAWYLSLSLSL